MRMQVAPAGMVVPENYQQQRLAIARESGDARQTLETLGNLALAYDANGDLPSAIECYHEQLSIARASLDDRVERNALKNLKLGYKYLADYEKANSIGSSNWRSSGNCF
jgi:Tetratricopeptide repeat.